VNSEETIELLGIDFPAFAIYAATANLSAPLALALVVWFAYHVEGIRAKGLAGYLRGWIPRGTPRGMRPLILVIEVISQSVRIVSLSVRLFANMLAGHLLILFMGGGLAVLLGVAALGVLTLPLAVGFFLFEMALSRRFRRSSSPRSPRSTWARRPRPKALIGGSAAPHRLRQLQQFPVEGRGRLGRRALHQRAEREAGLLPHPDQVADLVRGLGRAHVHRRLQLSAPPCMLPSRAEPRM
jgi:hypothetical protein